MNRAELKTNAKAQIKGKIGIMLLITLIIGAVSAVASWLFGLIPVVGKILGPAIVAPAFALSTARVALNVAAGCKPSAKDAFCGFNDFWSAIKLNLLTGLYIFLWSLLLVVPGIIKTFAYSMSTYILAENKGKSARECIKESKEMTNGYKFDLFVLGLSFIGWNLLCIVTFGIALIWVLPYMQVTYANAYNLLKSKKAAAVAE